MSMDLNEVLSVAEAASGPFFGVAFERTWKDGWECRVRLAPAADAAWVTSKDWREIFAPGQGARTDTPIEALRRVLQVIQRRRSELEAVEVGG